MVALVLLLVLGVIMHAARGFTPDGSEASTITGTELAFGFLILTAFLGGRIFAKLRSPQLTGYIVIGVIVGPYVLDLVSQNMVDALKIVNGVAVCLIALTAGGELSIRKMKPLLATIRSMTLWAVMGTTFLIAGCIYAIRAWDAAGPPLGGAMLPFLGDLTMIQTIAVCLMLAITLASQSPAVVMALINETKSDGPVSQTVLALVVIADLVVIVLYALASSVTTAMIGGGVNVMATVKLVAWELFGSAGIGLFIGVLLGMFLLHVKRGAALFVVLVCFVVAEVGIRLHLDPLIVTLIAGVYLENFSKVNAHDLIHDLESTSLPVYLVFFALAGASLNLSLLYAVLLPAAIIAVVRAFGFWLGCRKAARATGASAAVEQWAWIGLLPQAGLALALALLMTRTFGDFGIKLSTLVLGVVGLNQVVTPVLLRIALIRSGEAGKREMHEIMSDGGHGHGEDGQDVHVEGDD